MLTLVRTGFFTFALVLVLALNLVTFAPHAIAAPGQLDLSFNGTGKLVTPIGSSVDAARGMALHPDGGIVVAGACDIGPNLYDFCVARYHPNSSFDATFNGTGRVITPIGSVDDVATAVAPQTDGRIVVAGSCDIGGIRVFCVARYLANSALDLSFNGTGKTTTVLSSANNFAAALAVQDGRAARRSG